MYRPQKFKYLDYEVDKMQKFAFMEYQHDDKVITLYMDQNIDNQNSIAIGLDGKQIKKIVFDDENITITLLAVRDKADKEKNYVAYWKYEEVYYLYLINISGKSGGTDPSWKITGPGRENRSSRTKRRAGGK